MSEQSHQSFLKASLSYAGKAAPDWVLDRMAGRLCEEGLDTVILPWTKEVSMTSSASVSLKRSVVAVGAVGTRGLTFVIHSVHSLS